MEFRLPFPFNVTIKLPSWSIPLLFSIAAGYWIWQNGTYNQLIATPIADTFTTELRALWFSPSGDLIGRRDDGVVKWSATDRFEPWFEPYNFDRLLRSFESQRGPNSRDTASSRDTTSDRVFVSKDGTELGLLRAGTLVVTDFSDSGLRLYCFAEVEKEETLRSGTQAAISVLSFTDTGLIVLGRANGSIEFRDPRSRSCEIVGRTQTTLHSLNAIRSLDRYVVVSSLESRAVVVLDLRAIQQEVSPKSYPLTSVTKLSSAVSNNGRVAVSTGGPNVFVESQSGAITDELGMWGRVEAIAFADENRILAGGAYRDIHLLEKDKLPQLVAEAPRGTRLIAANATHIAFADVDKVTILSRTNTLVLTTRGKLVLGLAVAGIFLAAAMFIRDRFQEGLYRRSRLLYEIKLPDKTPEDLVRACGAGECVLYGGAGLSARARFPVWKDFVHGLLDWAHSQKIVTDREVREFHADIDNGQPDSVADAIVSRLPKDSELLRTYLKRVFGTSLTPLTETHRLLKSLNFSGVLTTNFDNLLERLYDLRSDQVFTPRDADTLLNCLTTRRFFLLKLYGSLDKAGPLMVAPAEYDAEVTGNRLFGQFMESLLLSRTLLFIGASLEGIETYLRGISVPSKLDRQHFAVVAVEGSGWRAKADLLRRRYNIEVLPYTAGPGYPELDIFLQRLAEEVALIPQATAKSSKTASKLKRVTLENIGAFEKFDLDLDTSWQVLLGDNGVGKSTILKAIALALAGEKAESFANRFIRSGQTTARITLETDQKTSYVTELRRVNEQEAEIRTTGGRPLRVEGWLAIGFPPLRTVGWTSPSGPSSDRVVTSRPVPEDLLPLIAGDPDPRLEKLKQWIIDLEFLTTQNEKLGRGRGERYQNLIHDMFKVINSTMEGLQLTYKGVEPITNRILVEDQTGVRIPLEALSQGTTSLIGWVGVLMQRLYEVYGDDTNVEPTKRYALILMDELDAHMHPVWQQILVSRLKAAFPNAQFIATTHSPLVVGGMPARQVLPLERDTTGVHKVSITADATFGYVDQRLTSPLFRLDSGLPESTRVKLKRYHELLVMKDRGPFQAEFEKLEQELMFRIPPPMVADEEKRKRMVEKAEFLKQIGEDLAEQKVEGSSAILGRAEKLRSDLERGPEE